MVFDVSVILPSVISCCVYVLSKSLTDRESRDSRMSDVIVDSWRDCFRTGEIVMIVIIMMVSAISASIVKNWAFVFIRSICRDRVALFYFGRL